MIEFGYMSLNAFWSDPTDGTSFLSSHVFQSFSGSYGYTLAHQHVLRKFVQHVFLSFFPIRKVPSLVKFTPGDAATFPGLARIGSTPDP
jgi:hypothetical protein